MNKEVLVSAQELDRVGHQQFYHHHLFVRNVGNHMVEHVLQEQEYVIPVVKKGMFSSHVRTRLDVPHRIES